MKYYINTNYQVQIKPYLITEEFHGGCLDIDIDNYFLYYKYYHNIDILEFNKNSKEIKLQCFFNFEKKKIIFDNPDDAICIDGPVGTLTTYCYLEVSNFYDIDKLQNYVNTIKAIINLKG